MVKRAGLRFLMILALLITGCAQQKPSSTTTPEKKVQTEQKKVEPSTQVTPTAPPAPLDGKTLVDERCSVCHTLERVQEAIQAKKYDWSGWEATVERMVGNGARLTEEEQRTVLDYLAGQ